MRPSVQFIPQHESEPCHADGEVVAGDTVHIRVGISLRDAERELIRATLAQTGGNRSKTARLLGMGRKTLYRKLEEYGLQ